MKGFKAWFWEVLKTRKGFVLHAKYLLRMLTPNCCNNNNILLLLAYKLGESKLSKTIIRIYTLSLEFLFKLTLEAFCACDTSEMLEYSANIWMLVRVYRAKLKSRWNCNSWLKTKERFEKIISSLLGHTVVSKLLFPFI